MCLVDIPQPGGLPNTVYERDEDSLRRASAKIDDVDPDRVTGDDDDSGTSIHG